MWTSGICVLNFLSSTLSAWLYKPECEKKKFYRLNFPCRRTQRGEKQRPDRLKTDFQVGDVRTDCTKPRGCSRRGPLFKSQLETALIQICPVPRWSSILWAGSSWRADLVFFLDDSSVLMYFHKHCWRTVN